MFSSLKIHRKVFKFLNGFFWVLVIPFSSHFLISIRRADSFSMLIKKPYYWTALFYSLLLTYLTVFVVSKLSAYWDKVEVGKKNHINRTFKQLIFGGLVPFIAIIITAIIYFYFFKGQAMQRGYFLKEIPIIALYLCLLNIFYISVYLNKQILTLRKKCEDEVEPVYQNKLLVHYRGNYVPVGLNEIALINQINRINWLITFKGEKHILDLSLTAIQALLNEKQFFKINRNQIVNKESIKGFNAGSFGKIELILEKHLTATVSKDRAKQFKAWYYI